MTVVSETRFLLEAREDNTWLGNPGRGSSLLGERALLSVRTTAPAEDVEHALERALCASWTQLDWVVTHGIRGVPLRRVASPDDARAGEHFFSFQRDSELWPDVLGSGTLAIHLPGLPLDATTVALWLPSPSLAFERTQGTDPLAALRLEWRLAGGLCHREGPTGADALLRFLGPVEDAASMAPRLAQALTARRARLAESQSETEPEPLDVGILRHAAHRAGLDALERAGLAPADLDVARHLLETPPGAPILPSEADLTRPDEIAARLARYTGLSIDTCERRMRPRALSHAGFLTADERFGDRVAADARVLADLGMTHGELARRLGLVLAMGDYVAMRRRLLELERRSPNRERVTFTTLGSFVPVARRLHAASREHGAELLLRELPYEVELGRTMGWQQHPFHVFDSQGFLLAGSGTFTIRNLRSGTVLRGPDLAVSLIGDACFFGSAHEHRVSPELAVRTLADDSLAL
jgi:hypothetical protein